MPPELTELLKWIEKADHDLRTSELAIGFTRPITDTAAFHCQQAVEKLLKAFLFWREHDFEKIHDLRALALSCAKYDPDFGLLIDRIAPLTAYAVRFRYPGPNEPTVEEVREAIKIVREVWSFVMDRLPPEARIEMP